MPRTTTPNEHKGIPTVEGELMEKSVTPSYNPMVVVGEKGPIPIDQKGKTKALFVDPWYLSTMYAYREPRVINMSFDLLWRMSRSTVVSSIITTRLNQIASFSVPQRYQQGEASGGLGFKVKLKDKHPKKYTQQDNKRVIELEEWLMKTGSTPRIRPDGKDRRPNLSTFLKMVIRDSLRYDQGCFEKVRDRKGKIVEVWPIDGATVRLAQRNDEAAYIQVISGMPKVAFWFNEMGFFIRNPRTDLKANGYGYSELEDMINTITSHLYAEQYNQRIFSQGTNIKGILNLKGDIPSDMLTEFRAHWQRLTSGMDSVYKTPVMRASEGAEFINFGGTNKEMEYSRWLEYLIRVACGKYAMDPAEINFDLKGASGQKPMFESNPEAKLKYSKDKGLRPLLKDIAQMITEEIVEEIGGEEWMFTFTGIDAKSDEELIKNRQTEVQSYKTVDEVREEAGLDKLGEEKGGDMILNAVYSGAMNAKAMQAQQSEGMDNGEESPYFDDSGDQDGRLNEGDDQDSDEEDQSADEGEPDKGEE